MDKTRFPIFRWAPDPQYSLAHRLGVTCHISPLLYKVKRTWRGWGGGDFETWLIAQAAFRGAFVYKKELASGLELEMSPLSDEEIGVCLCLPHLRDDPNLIRAAAQLLSSSRVDPHRLVRLAFMERCERVVIHIAGCCLRVEPDNPLWSKVSQRLGDVAPFPDGYLPHWSRFVFQRGLTRNGKSKIQWLHAA